MYRPGDLKLLMPPCRQGRDCDCDPPHRVPDARSGGVVRGQAAFLPHSCDEWVIGGPDEVRALIADLQAALQAFEGG